MVPHGPPHPPGIWPRVIALPFHAEGTVWRALYPAWFDEILTESGRLAPAVLDAITPICRAALATGALATREPIVIGTVHALAAAFPHDPQGPTLRIYSPFAAAEALLATHLAGGGQSSGATGLHASVQALALTNFANLPVDRLTREWKLARFDDPAATVPGPIRDAIEARTLALTARLEILRHGHRRSLAEWAQDRMLEITTASNHLRVHALRLIAALPSLNHDAEGHIVKRMVLETLDKLRQGPGAITLPAWIALALPLAARVARWLPARTLARALRDGAGLMANRFIAGETPGTIRQVLSYLAETGRSATLDQLGELVLADSEAEHYEQSVHRLLDIAAAFHGRGQNAAGVPLAHVSVKLSALCADFNPQAPHATAATAGPRLARVLAHARDAGAFICLDGEHHRYRSLPIDVLDWVLTHHPELRGTAIGLVIQAYLRDSVPFAHAIVDLARRHATPIQIRLVKGAYWDVESIQARAHSLPAPVFLNKAETDVHFRQLAALILSHPAELRLAVASHNVRDHAFAEALREAAFPNTAIIEHQTLHRTAEGISRALTAMGWPVRDYVPAGNLLTGMAYLVRRILENSSQAGFLAQSRHDMPVAAVAADPARLLSAARLRGEALFDPAVCAPDPRYRTTPPIRFHLAGEREAFQQALDARRLPQDPGTGEPSLDPSTDGEIIGRIPWLNPEATRALVTRAREAQPGWEATPPAHRAAILVRAAEIMRVRRAALAALVLREAGKAWAEAAGDVDEAIDFLQYYAREEVRLHATRPWAARGVVAVLSPWNFPLAIPCGMTAAALAAGNAAILKPAEQTPLIAAELMAILHEAGVPPEVAALAPGDGESTGSTLANHPGTDMIVFTGSRQVGYLLHALGAKPDRARPLPVVAEMGGKNAIIVTATADLDEAVHGVLVSAFGHAGQKCSAASRVLVDRAVATNFAARLREAAASLHVGPASDPATQVNPVITPGDRDRIRAAATRACQEAGACGGRVLIDRAVLPGPGSLVGPCIVEIPARGALQPGATAVEEIFGPVLHVIVYDSVEEAIAVANGVTYALTAGVFSQSPAEVEHIVSRLEAGNIYVNRPITGARVGVEPFGGFKASGTGPKAGGEDYLRAFHVTPAVHKIWADAAPAEPVPAGAPPEIRRPERWTAPLAARSDVVIAAVHRIVASGITTPDAARPALEVAMAAPLALAPAATVPIPGQATQLRFDLPRGPGAVVVGADLSHPLAALAAALAAGAGCVLQPASGAGAEVCKRLAGLLVEAGVPARVVGVAPAGVHPAWIGAVPWVEWVFVGGGPGLFRQVESVARAAAHQRPDGLRAVLSPLDGPGPDEIFGFLRQFTHPRVVAENIIRHGAPLEAG